MNSIYDHFVNSRILQGNLPYDAVEKNDGQIEGILDFFEKGSDMLHFMRETPVVLQTLLPLFGNVVQEWEALGQPDMFKNELNLIINTGYNPAVLDINSQPCQKAMGLSPVVTQVDKALWLGVCVFGNKAKLLSGDFHEEDISMFFAWLWLLKAVQVQELVHGKTIDPVAVCNAHELLFCSWKDNANPHLINISQKEQTDLKEIIYTREEIKSELKETLSKASNVAQETEPSWDVYLSILNNLIEQERNTVEQVVSLDLSATEKIRCIENYISLIRKVGEDKYLLGKKTVSLSKLSKDIKKRMQLAPAHCFVKDQSGQAFRLIPATTELIQDPVTFNFLFLTFHLFRLSPNKDNAFLFCSCAVYCLKRNLLNDKDEDYNSIDEIVSAFHQTLNSFLEDNYEAIEKLSQNRLDKIQPDTVIMGPVSLTAIATALFNDHLVKTITSASEDLSELDTDSAIELIQDTRYTKDQIAIHLEREEYQAKEIKDYTLARQIIASLNIIYLFCDALRLMRDSKNSQEQYFDNRALIEQCHADLEWESEHLSYSVYSRSANIKKHRLERGIDARTLSEHESAEEKLRSAAFVENILSALDDLTKDIETQNVEELIELKNKIRSKIRACSICNLTDQFSEKLISISIRICNRLTSLCSSTFNDYDLAKQKLLSVLGSEARLLPPSALDSLTTAELLYRHYASELYAQKGFDYSCISALYYQSFEEAYNKLIWQDYADMLNTKQIDGRYFTSILRESKGKDLLDENATGYLPIDSYDRSFYTNRHHSAVLTTCTYGNFGEMLKRYVTPKSKVLKLCDYFAKLAGFSDYSSMFNDTPFMKKVQELSDAVLAATKRRNEASHGGNLITIKQCISDKQTVLDELEEVRDSSIGLIQKLLYLMRNSPITFYAE